MLSLKEKFGSWAIVTGASSGIGKEFSKQLAERGLNLILLARRADLLSELAQSLQSNYKVDIKYASIDLINADFLLHIEELAKGLDVGLLISNAGSGLLGRFADSKVNELEEMLRLNVLVHMKLSHWFVSRLLKEQKKGGLMLTSSTTAYQGTPFFANYSAAKAYILNLGEALNFELKDKGVHVTVLVPGPTDTPALDEMGEEMKKKMRPQRVEPLVREGLKSLVKNKPYQIGGSMNRIIIGIMKVFISRKRATAFWGKMMKGMVS